MEQETLSGSRLTQCLVIHIVKRFGRVGGMESYVWHLVNGLAERGVQTAVICEHVYELSEKDIQIVKVEPVPERPRWKSMMTFRDRVDKTIRDQFHGRSVLIHSHERSLCHQVTTFHGAPIEKPKGLEQLLLPNKRFNAWQEMERHELLGASVQMILSVSTQIQGQLASRYPEIADKKNDLAWPGVAPPVKTLRTATGSSSGDVKFLFVGKEWRRKGFDIAIRVVEEFRKTHATANLTAFGIDEGDLPWNYRSPKWISFKGWSYEIPWTDFDILIHPARQEPFGMVIAEARAHGVPVVISTQVGALDLKFSDLEVIDIASDPSIWCQAVAGLLKKSARDAELKWTWNDLVSKHLQVIYPQISKVIL